MEETLKKYRAWQKENSEWELVCDVEDTEALYIQWDELPKDERMHWIGLYHEDPKGAFEEFGTKRCKVPTGCLWPDLTLHHEFDWGRGFCMLVFKTDNKSLNADLVNSAG